MTRYEEQFGPKAAVPIFWKVNDIDTSSWSYLVDLYSDSDVVCHCNYLNVVAFTIDRFNFFYTELGNVINESFEHKGVLLEIA